MTDRSFATHSVHMCYMAYIFIHLVDSFTEPYGKLFFVLCIDIHTPYTNGDTKGDLALKTNS